MTDRIRWLIGTAVLLVVAPHVAAQQGDPVSQALSLTPDNGVAPIWQSLTERSLSDLSRVVHVKQPAIFLVGHPDHGYGTAFVISAQHRLLATNAHVADILHDAGTMLAIRNDSSEVYNVDRVWYHPGVRRRTSLGSSIRDPDPRSGPIDPHCPDIAVLHLADGPGLPQEFPLATPDEIGKLLAQPVGMIGFPAHDTVSWPGIGQKAQATFRQGVVCRLTDFSNSPDAPRNELQYVQHSMASWFGFSGSPIFLPNGHVVILHNSASAAESKGLHVSLAFGIRIDCLWELLAHHNLDGQIPLPVDRSALSLARYQQPDPASERIARAKQLVKDAWDAANRKQYQEAVHLANQAIELVPNYADAYEVRCQGYDRYANRNLDTSASDARYLQWALADAKKLIALRPQAIDPLLRFCELQASVSYALGDADYRSGVRSGDPLACGVAERLLSMGDQLKPYQKAWAYSIRARSRSDSQNRLADLNAAISIQPYHSGYYYTRASYWRNTGYPNYGASDQARAESLERANQSNREAWTLATSADDTKRDGKRAVELAKWACGVTNYEYPAHLDTLAAAYAEAGDFASAVKWASRAVQLASDEEKAEYQRRLALYKADKQYRQH